MNCLGLNLNHFKPDDLDDQALAAIGWWQLEQGRCSTVADLSEMHAAGH